MQRKISVTILVVIVVAFFTWRFIRPMNIFIVEDKFAWPTDTSAAPPMLQNLSAENCRTCHPKFYDEWQTTIHSQAWVDPYFQTDWLFDGAQHICRLCHTPLDKQQPHKITGYRDKNKWDPIMENNPDFDPKLQHEGVTCTACHYSKGKILGMYGNTSAPHPVEKLVSPNQICVRCHVVSGKRWDTFFRFPPCGTVAEIKSSHGETFVSDSGEMSFEEIASLGCVDCHMPTVERPLVKGGKTRLVRRHLWRGGHNPQMVKQALTIALTNNTDKENTKSGNRRYSFTITNTGAAHYVPTGTPDRHLTVSLRVLDTNKQVIDEQLYTLKRTVMWRPFIVDLWDTRLKPGLPREYNIKVAPHAAFIEANVRYHLMDESRRARINYKNKEPIAYSIYRELLSLDRI